MNWAQLASIITLPYTVSENERVILRSRNDDCQFWLDAGERISYARREVGDMLKIEEQEERSGELNGVTTFTTKTHFVLLDAIVSIEIQKMRKITRDRSD